jgi:membrane protein DedA with SNARE-associated domain
MPMPAQESPDIEASYLATPQAEQQGWRERRRTRRAEPEDDVSVLIEAAPPSPTHAMVARTVATLERGPMPEPGVQAPPYRWDDLLDGGPPASPSDGDGAYAVYHALEVDADLRISYQTIVSVRASHHGQGPRDLLVDARTSVQKRALLEVMDRARSNADKAAHRRRERLGRRLSRRRQAVLHWPHWAMPLGFGWVRVQAKLATAGINLSRNLTYAAVEIPDGLASRLLRVDAHLSSRMGRASLWDGIKNPQGLTAEQRSVVLFLTLASIAVGILVINSVFALGASRYADTWRDMLQLFLLQIAGLFGLPLPIEVPFMAALLSNNEVSFASVALALGAVMAGKMVGAWILYLLGDGLLDHVRKHTKSERAKRMVGWLTGNADKHGFTILLADNAIPFMPDQLMLVLAVAGMRFRSWMWGIGIGTFLKFGGIVAAVYLIGPERVTHFFEHPLG